MSDTGKQSPLGVNALSSLVQNIGFNINPIMVDYVGVSTSNSSCTSVGSIVSITCLLPLTYAIQDAYTRGQVNSTTYNNLIAIGSTSIPGMGNSPPSTFNWTGYPNWASSYTYTNSVTQWGYVRLFALQAYNEFNYNSGLSADSGAYKDFLSSFMSIYSFVEYSNDAILAVNNSQEFLDGTYSNMDDLITADITGVSIATTIFGQDLIISGKAINLQYIATFGLPSNLLATLKNNNAITKSVTLALIASGITIPELNEILSNFESIAREQERKMYSAFSIIVGQDLNDILVSLNCKTAGIESLADLLNPKKLFPNSYLTLTVPVYNTLGGPANSKIYYPIYVNDGLNSQLNSPTIGSQLVNAAVGKLVTEAPEIVPTAPAQTLVYQYTMTDEQGNPIDLIAKLVNASDINIISAGDSGGDGGGAGGGGAGGGGAGGGGGGGGGAM